MRRLGNLVPGVVLVAATLACLGTSDAARADVAQAFIVEASFADGDLAPLTCRDSDPSVADWRAELLGAGGLVEDRITCDPGTPGEIFCEFDLENGARHAVVLFAFEGRRICSVPAWNFEVEP